ncbi:DUF2867 domain-containing protein [Maridesulfovibrio frigidus]|uniref:DUF2867 domain-containing protein n=1 Tax=Maridesulfovibrio frigidus TaxID=340956 RepID=UPI0004E13E21|nr:DUF2867 domain-containing protein [Maridesulfovibrio frigidus]
MNDSNKLFQTIPVLNDLAHGADYVDSKAFSSNRPMNEFLERLITYEPTWLVFLYKIRGVVAKIMELKHDVVDHQNSKKKELDFNAGGKVDFFTSVDFNADHYWIGEAKDKHLSGYLGVVAEPTGSGKTDFHTFTIVKFNHWTGPLYFNLIRPFHHIVVQCMGKYAAKD